MGNAELKKAFKNALTDQQSKEKLGLTVEILFEDSLITTVEEYIKEKMKMESLDKDIAFPENNFQVNEQSEDLYKRHLSSELNENYLSGFATAESTISSLQEPSFEKYFTVSTQQETTDYTKLQQQKFTILYALFVEKYREQSNKKQNFFEYIKKFLAKSDVNQRVQIGLESGFKFSLSLLKEVGTVNKDMLINSLEYLYQTLKYSEAGSLYSTDKLSFMIDQNLNDARDFLVTIIEAKDSAKRAVELAYKIIFMLGISRSNVEDFLVICTLLDKHNSEVDLSCEIELFKEEGEDIVSQDCYQKKDFSVRRNTKSASIFYLKAGTYKQEISKTAAFACDGNYIYVHQKGLGLLKMGTGAIGQMMGQVYQHNPVYRSDEQVQLLFLNNQLFCRSESLKPKPFVTINTTTLEEEKQEFELEKEDQNLEWKQNLETGRSLTFTPLLSDGNYIYVIVEKTHSKNDNGAREQEDHKLDKELPQLVVECYLPSTNSFKFVKKVTLYNDDQFEPFNKEEKLVDPIKNASFATNGQILLMQTSTASYFFDLTTGIKLQKVELSLYDAKDAAISYDYSNNLFYQFKTNTANIKVDAYQIIDFNKTGAALGFAKEYLTNRLQNFRSQIKRNIPQISGVKKLPSKLNLVERIMMNVTTPVLIKLSREESKNSQYEDQVPQLMKTLILRHIESSCQQFDFQLDAIIAQGKNASEIEDHMITFFKFPNATYLTYTLFHQIQENLDRCNDIINSKKTTANLSSQYSFYFIIKILTSNFNALSFCSIALSDIMDEESYQKFIQSYKNCIIRVIQEGCSDNFEEGQNLQEIKVLWQEIQRMCVQILSVSIKLIYTDITEILTKLSIELKTLQNQQQGQNCSVLLHYLSEPENCKKLLTMGQEELILLYEIFKQCCQIKSNEMTEVISNNILSKNSTFEVKKSLFLIDSCNKFIKSICEQLLIQYCTLTEQMSIKKSDSTLQITEEDKNMLARIEEIISTFFQETAFEMVKSIQNLTSKLQQTLQQNDDVLSEITTDQYEKYSSFMDQVFVYQSAFYEIVTLNIQTFSILKLQTKLLPLITSAVISIVSEINLLLQVINIYEIKFKAINGKDKLKKSFDSFSRNLSWFIGLTSYKLIKVEQTKQNQEQEDNETENEKMQELIIQSNLFSGGIESRFIDEFSIETQQSLHILFQISQDSQTQKLLRVKSELLSEDELLQAIIYVGNDPKVDQVIIYLQQLLEKKIPFVPYARLGGKDGMRLSRAAFAVMIKFSEFFNDFYSLIDEVDIKTEELLCDKQDKDNNIKEFMQSLLSYEQIFKVWDSASKMRQWINEKKSHLIQKIRKEVEIEYSQKKKIENEDKGKIQIQQEQLKANAIDTEQINTSSAANINNEKEINETYLSDNDQTAIDELADLKFNNELEKIYAQIIEKAGFIIKLQVPAVFLVKDLEKKKEGSLLFINQPPTQEESNETKVQIKSSEFDWKDRLKNWRQVQTSKGAIKNFTDRKKEMFESSVMSILACLQTSIQAQRIKNQVEKVFLNAQKRIAGLNLIGQLINMNLPLTHRYDLINWFCSSLRANKNQMAHYLDDLKGCGQYLEEEAKEKFFGILKGLIRFIKSSKDEPEIKTILNSLKWKFIARDHQNLRTLEIFKILNEGDGEKENKLMKSWGRPLKQEVIKNLNDQSLSRQVIDVFEQVFLLLVGRIVKPDAIILTKHKQDTSLLKLQKAQSVIDDNVSEILISSGIAIIFKEFERYIKIAKMQNGVEWTFYVKMRNLEKINKEQKQDNKDLNLLDEEDEQQEIEEEKENLIEETKATSGDNINNEEGTIDASNQSKKEEEDLDEKQKEQDNKKQETRAQKEIKDMRRLYSESFLRRLLRLIEIFTNIASVSPNPKEMIQRVASPIHLQILLELLILASPRIKIVVLKVIQHLLKIALPFQIFEDSITLLTKDPLSQAYDIYNKLVLSQELGGSKFLRFLYNYLLSVRHNMWTITGIESEGQYAVTQEIVNLFRFVLEAAPQENFRKALQDKFNQVLFQPFEMWNIEETDIIFSIIPSGSFARLMIGSEALYKDSTRVVILGFSQDLKEDETLINFDELRLKSFQQTINMIEPAKQRALVYFIGDGSVNYAPEIRALEITSLLPISTQNITTEDQKSILYDKKILGRFIEILDIEVNKETQPSILQAQIQILKSIQFLIETERKNNNSFEFLNFLQEEKLLKDLLQHIQKNANKPDIIGQNDKNLPIDLMELSLTTLRIKALENEITLLDNDNLVAHFSNHDSITFYKPPSEDKGFQLDSIQIQFSINEKILNPSYKKTLYQVVFFSEIIQKKELLTSKLQVVVFEHGQLDANTDLVIQVIQKANIIISTDNLSPKVLLQQLTNIDTIHKTIDQLNQKPIFIISQKNLNEMKEKLSHELNYKKFDQKWEQYQDMVIGDLSEWGGFSDDQLLKLAQQNLDKSDKGVEAILKLSEAIPSKFVNQENDIKKLLVGKIAIQTRKQNSQTNEVLFDQIQDDQGIKIWDQCFKEKALEEIIAVGFGKMVNVQVQQSENELEKRKQYQNVLDVKNISSNTVLKPQYTKILNKLLKLHSRKVLITFLNQINPLPIELFTDIEDLHKLLLLAFNEGLQIRGLTGNRSVLKSIKILLQRISKDSSLRSYFNDFLNDQVIKSSTIVIKNIINDKNFLTEEAFNSEVDAQMYPSPLFIYSITKMLIKESSEILLQTRGLIPNILSVLVGLAFAYTIRAPALPLGPAKPLTIAIKLVQMIVDNPQNYQYIDDVVNHIIQAAKLKRVTDLILNKDALQIVQLIALDKGGEVITKLHEKILEIKQNYNCHPDGYCVPFIAKIKSLQNSDGMQLMISGIPAEPTDHKFQLSYDPEGKYKIVKKMMNNSKVEVIMRKQIYLVYSNDPSNSLMAFGDGQKGRLANGSIISSQRAKRVDINHAILKIESAQYHTVILSDKGEAYRCGQIKGCKALTEFESIAKTVKLIAAGRSNIAIIKYDNSLWQIGKSKNNHFKKEEESEGLELYQQDFSPEIKGQISSISSGNHFTLCITSQGKLYGSGDCFLNEINIENKERKMVLIPLKEGVLAKRVWCSKAKGSFAAIIEVQEEGVKYLMSAGLHLKGLLGQGGQIEQSKTFEKLDYDHLTIVFTSISIFSDHAYALTNKGELYGWGSNEGFRLGFKESVKKHYSPQILSFFENKSRFKILSFVCGEDHSLVYLEETSEQDNTILGPRLYQVGYDKNQSDSLHRGVSNEELQTNQNITNISEFDNKTISIMAAGKLCSFIYFKDTEKPIDETKSWMQNHIKHEIAKQTYQTGTLHFYFDSKNLQDITQRNIVLENSPKQKNSNEEKIRETDPYESGWHFYTQNEILNKLDTPSVSIALKHTIPNLYKKIDYFKEVLEIANQALHNQPHQSNYAHGINCSDCGESIEGIRYYAAYQVFENLKEVNLCEQCFQQPTEYDIIPLVYFRLLKGLSDNQQLPLIELGKLFICDANFKVELQVSTLRKYFNNKSVIIDLLKQMEPTLKLRQHYIQLLSSKINKQIEQKIIVLCDESPLDELELFITQYKEHEKDFRAILNKCENDVEETLRNKIKATIKKFDFLTKDNLEDVFDTVQFLQNYFTISMKIMKKISLRSLKNESMISLPVVLNKLMKNVPFVIKNQLFQAQVNALPTGDRYSLAIRRGRAMVLAESGGCDHEGTQSIFGQIMQELKKNATLLKCFKINTPDARIFRVEFKGEGSIDEGGPYRDTMTNLCQELQSPCLPLLIPTPNNKNNHGQYRECWTINPSSTSPTHMEMFTYLGYYIGMAIRSEQALPLDLAPIFWKNILEEHLVDSDQQKELNLKEFDTFSWQILEDLRAQSKNLSQEEFEGVIDEPFVTLLSNGTEVELLPGGKSLKVNKENLENYIKLVVNARLTEASKQYKAIIEGINFVIDQNIWRILSWKQIEKRATGSKIIDLVRLKEITEYQGGQVNDPHIKIFWDVLESFTDPERSLYLKFVWGRARLPLRTGERHKIKTMSYNPKSSLPISHTCFFTLDLPTYPEFQICRDKILFAIMFCGDIDADRSSYSIDNDMY